MKRISTKSVFGTLAILSIVLVLAGAAIIQGAAPTSNSFEPPEASVSSIEGFMRLPPDQEAALKAIVLNDPQIKNLIEATEYDYRINVGVRLVENIKTEELVEWLRNGQKDTSFIREHVGVINIGYNASYTFSINTGERSVVGLTVLPKTGPTIPELTREDKEKALALVSNDPLIQELLAGKGFEVAPDQRIGVWHNSDLEKLGVVMEIWFDHPYTINADLPTIDYDTDKYAFPGYVVNAKHFSGNLTRLVVGISLVEDRIVNVTPLE